LLEHLLGTTEAAKRSNIVGFRKTTQTGNVIDRLAEVAGKLPKSNLNIDLPDWLCDAEKHHAACKNEIKIYQKIVKLTTSISVGREARKAHLLTA
ncbi:MAG: hypothetical protein GY814_10675, partial [Gammaproteobacteria bacterium]|nr:hypothetical protein [Gammaproteobacteria bacterium]